MASMLQRAEEELKRNPGRFPPLVEWSAEVSEVGCLVWADNVSLMGSSTRALQSRITDLANRFAQVGLTFSPESLQFLRNSAFETGTLRITPGGHAFAGVERMVCLGVALDTKCRTETQTQYRVDQSRGSWIRFRNRLLCDRIPPSERHRLLQRTVGASILYGAGSWVPSAQLAAGNCRSGVAPSSLDGERA